MTIVEGLLVDFATIFLLAFFVEAVTEILVSGDIFFKIRDWIGRKSAFLGELIYCGYCTSVWVAGIIAWVNVLVLSDIYIVNYFITVMILHRLSNIIHELNSKIFGRRPWALAIHKSEVVVLPEEFYDGRQEETGDFGSIPEEPQEGS